jgi:hypothetical protein
MSSTDSGYLLGRQTDDVVEVFQRGIEGAPVHGDDAPGHGAIDQFLAADRPGLPDAGFDLVGLFRVFGRRQGLEQGVQNGICLIGPRLRRGQDGGKKRCHEDVFPPNHDKKITPSRA